MYRYLNVHPEGLRVKDCVKRALSLAFNTPYKKMQLELNRFKKVSGCKHYSANIHWKTYVEARGGRKMSFPAVAGQTRMNGAKFAERYPSGTFLLNMAGHVATCVDGVIYDTFDCTRKCVYTAYEIPPEIKNCREGGCRR